VSLVLNPAGRCGAAPAIWITQDVMADTEERVVS